MTCRQISSGRLEFLKAHSYLLSCAVPLVYPYISWLVMHVSIKQNISTLGPDKGMVHLQSISSNALANYEGVNSEEISPTPLPPRAVPTSSTSLWSHSQVDPSYFLCNELGGLSLILPTLVLSL
ncbi:hypothetical protein BDR07DRAFT_1408177 [Suillus spraguei]|nr:hypothetical protein BDR07DRAFT_1408177 [Suillus spraguei]